MASMDTKTRQMIAVLNSNDSGRVYEGRNIDMGWAGYIKINDAFDVEIVPSCIRGEKLCSVYLWQTAGKGRQMRVAASLRRIPWTNVDMLVGLWQGQMTDREALTGQEVADQPSVLYVALENTTC